MKKSLFVLGMAVAALASCTNEEVTEIAQSNAIGFNTFVNNNTKAVTPVESLISDFYVFGNFGTDQSTWTGQVFNNELSTERYYWQQGNYYRFGAYANGANGKIDNAKFIASTQTLEFESYTPDDAKDLVAAIGTGDASASIPADKVSLSFSHMLAQVGFTFKTQDGDEYTIAISDIKILKAVKTAKGTFTPSEIKWEGTAETDAAYTYENIADIADGKDHQQYKLVIPQPLPSDNNKIQVTFKAAISGAGLTAGPTNEKVFTLDLTSPDTEGWKPGYCYNYTATVNGSNINDQLKPIEFTVTSVAGWQNATMGDDGTILPTD